MVTVAAATAMRIAIRRTEAEAFVPVAAAAGASTSMPSCPGQVARPTASTSSVAPRGTSIGSVASAGSMARMTDLDGIDRALLRALIADGRATYAELASAVGLSASSVAERIRRLRREGVLTGFTALIDESALGMALSAISDVTLREDVDRVEFAESLSRIPQVAEALRVTGPYDYQLRILASGTAELEAVIDLLKREYGVASANSRLIMREVARDRAAALGEDRSRGARGRARR